MSNKNIYESNREKIDEAQEDNFDIISGLASILAYRLIRTDEGNRLDIRMLANEVYGCVLAVYYV